MRRLLVASALLWALAGADSFAADCKMSLEFNGPEGTPIWKTRGAGPVAFYFRSNSDVDADGSGHAYHPDDIAGNKGLAQDILCVGVNRRGGGNCLGSKCQSCLDLFRSVDKQQMISNFATFFESFAIATKGKAACVVPEGGANAGYFVSTTSYIHSDIIDVCDPGRYLDAMIFPGIAVPKSLTSRGVKFGDFVLVRNRKNGKSAFGVVYDGSGGRIGESSIAMNRLLLCRKDRPGCETPENPKTLKETNKLVVSDADYLIFAGSVGQWPSAPEAVNTAASALFNQWGGDDRLTACASAYRR
jgi:hypothetical protein